MKINPIIALMVLMINLFPQDKSVFIAKSHWHSGIIIPIDSISSKYLPMLTTFADSGFIDIGMGEKDFYMSPSQDILPAAKAILIPTEATIRIATVPGDTAFIKRTSDFLVELKMDESSYKLLLNFIDSSITEDETGNKIIIEKRANGEIVFFESTESYHLFNTCNTWIAKALEYTRIEIDPSDVITSQELFRELLNKGKILKFDKSESIF